MQATIKSNTTHTLELDGVSYALRLKPDDVSSVIVHKRKDGRVVFGYLLQDSDCQNPLESDDGVGQIYSLSHRHVNHKSLAEVQAILASDPDAVALSYFEHGDCLWDVQGGAFISQCPDLRWDGVKFAGVWVPDDCVRESYTGQDGKTRREWMIEQAARACQEYTAWLNGDCWGVVVVICKADGTLVDSDETWGYVGGEYALEEVAARVKSTAHHVNKIKPGYHVNVI